MKTFHQGFSLPLALILCTVLLFAGIALSGVARNQLSLANVRIRGEMAQAAADGGLVQALAALAASSTYSGNSTPALVAEGPESYTVAVLRAPALLPDGQTIPTGCVYVRSTGTYSNTATQQSCALVQMGTGTAFQNLRGVWASMLTLDNGASVDSYNSTQGAYGKKNRANNGSVATNSVASGSIRILGGANIYGPVSVGPGGSIEAHPAGTNVGQAYTIWHDWGTTFTSAAAMTQTITLPPMAAPTPSGSSDAAFNSGSKTLAPGSYRDVTISNGAQITLNSGVYVFRNLTLSGGASLTVNGSGPVQAYVSGHFILSNGVSISNSTVSPSLFQLYMGDGSEYTQSGGTQLSGIVYGPAASIEMSNGAAICGALVGQKVTMDGSAAVHFDESLSSFRLGGSSSGSGTNKVLFRQRL